MSTPPLVGVVDGALVRGLAGAFVRGLTIVGGLATDPEADSESTLSIVDWDPDADCESTSPTMSPDPDADCESTSPTMGPDPDADCESTSPTMGPDPDPDALTDPTPEVTFDFRPHFRSNGSIMSA